VFAPPTPSRLVSRLKHVCAHQNLTGLAVSSLTALTQASGGDIRTAINTLQFAAMRAHAMAQVQFSGGSSGNSTGGTSSCSSSSFQQTLGAMITSGLKDEKQDVFQLWSQVFSFKQAALQFNKQKQFTLIAGATYSNSSSSNSNSDSGRGRGGSSKGCATHAMLLLDSVLGFNDTQLVLSGVQENYLGVRQTSGDPSLIKTSSAADWLSVGNVLEGKMYVMMIG
jgi:hypothetical protein